MNIIPKRFKEVKGFISGRFTWIDTVVISLFMLLAIILMFVIGIDVNQISNNVGLLTALIILLISPFMIVSKNKYGRKRYLVMIDMFKFLSGNNSYKKVNGKIDAFPYYKIERNILIGDKSYSKVIKIKGVDLFQFSEVKQNSLISSFMELVNDADLPITLTKINRHVDYNGWAQELASSLDSERMAFVNSYGHKLKEWARIKLLLDDGTKSYEDVFTEYDEQWPVVELTSVKVRLQLLSHSVEQIKDLNHSELTETVYFLTVTSSSIDVLEQQHNTIFSTAQLSGFEPEEVSSIDLPAYVSSFFRAKNYTTSDAMTLENVLPNKITFKKDCYEMELSKFTYSNTEKKRVTTENVSHRFAKVVDIFELPQTVDTGWLANLIDSSQDMYFIKYEKMNQEKAIKELDKKIMIEEEARTVLRKTSGLHRSEATEEAMTLVLQNVTEGESILNTTIKVVLIARSKSELDHKYSELARVIRKKPGYNIDPLEFRQKEGYSSIVPRMFDVTFLSDAQNIPLSTFAEGYPLMVTKHQDYGSPILGYTPEDSPVMINTRIRTPSRQNSTVMILGKSGSGKSFFGKKLIKDDVSVGSKIFIVDPEDEWSVLTTNLKGDNINMSSKSEHKLNPFEYFSSGIKDEEEEESGLSGHITFLSEFLATAARLTTDQALFIPRFLNSFYESLNISGDNAHEINQDDWPIMKEFIDFVTTCSATEKGFDSFQIKSVASKLQLLASDPYKMLLWNHKSNFKIKNSTVTTFNIKELYEVGSGIVLAAQTALLVRFIDKYIGENKTKHFKPIEKLSMKIDKLRELESKLPYGERRKLNRRIYDLEIKKLEAEIIWEQKKITVLVDEAHLLLDEDNPQAVKFLARGVKRYRKYNTQLIIITQNIRDFNSDGPYKKHTETIVNNNQYMFVFKLNPPDAKSLDELLEASGGLTDSDIREITTATRGKCLAIISESSKQIINIRVSDKEKQIMTAGI